MIATRTPASSPHGTPGLSLLPAAVRARLYNEPFSRRSCLSVFDGCGMEHRVPLCCSPPHTLPHVHIQTYNSTRRRGGFFALRSQIMHHDWIMIVTIVTPSLTPPPPPRGPGLPAYTLCHSLLSPVPTTRSWFSRLRLAYLAFSCPTCPPLSTVRGFQVIRPACDRYFFRL